MSGPDTRRDFLAGRALLRLADRDAPVEERSVPVSGPTVRLETRAMACPWSVVMNPGPPDQIMAASEALDLLHPIEAQLSIYRDDSLISQLKTLKPGEWRSLPPEVFALLVQCQEFSTATEGAFDPTSGPLIRLWRECRQAGRIPEQSEIDKVAGLSESGGSTSASQKKHAPSDLSARQQAGSTEYTGFGESGDFAPSPARLSLGMSRRVELNPADSTIRVLTPGVEIDLGAIGKGYAIDRLCEALLSPSSPLPSFLIHGGFSSLRAHGHHHGLPGWPVGLRNPLFPDRNYATLLLKDRALATSGSNVQFFRHQGQRYGHILDPRTGWPVEGMLSVTVTAPTATEADALSTAFYVMGLEAAAEYCRQHPQIGAILVPPLTQGRTLTPLILNIPEEDLFFGDDVAVEG